MKISSKKNTSSVEFTVEFDKNDLEPARIKALSRLARDVKIPGFRNGKAPANIVEQHVDPNQLASETLDIAVRTAIPKLFDGTDMMPISIPHVEIAKYVPGEMAEITVKADIMPEVKLGDYKKIVATYDEPEISDKDVDDVLNRIAESFAESKVVKRAAKMTDEVIIDFVGKKDGIAFDGGSAKDFKLVLGSGQFIPGFEEGIVGLASGDKKDLKISFPEDYHVADLAGQPVVFEVLVKQVNERVKPAIDDELAKKTGAFDNIKALREDIRKNISSHAENEALEHYKDELLMKLVDSSKTEAPATLVQEQFEHMKEDIMRNLKSQGASIEDYLEHRKQKREEWEEEVKEAAKRRILGSIVVQKLADELGIEITDAEAEEQVAQMKEAYKKDAEASKQLDDPQVKANIKNRMRVERTIDKLVEINKPNAKKSAKKSTKTDDKKPAKKTTKKSSK